MLSVYTYTHILYVNIYIYVFIYYEYIYILCEYDHAHIYIHSILLPFHPTHRMCVDSQAARGRCARPLWQPWSIAVILQSNNLSWSQRFLDVAKFDRNSIAGGWSGWSWSWINFEMAVSSVISDCFEMLKYRGRKIHLVYSTNFIFVYLTASSRCGQGIWTWANITWRKRGKGIPNEASIGNEHV